MHVTLPAPCGPCTRRGGFFPSTMTGVFYMKAARWYHDTTASCFSFCIYYYAKIHVTKCIILTVFKCTFQWCYVHWHCSTVITTIHPCNAFHLVNLKVSAHFTRTPCSALPRAPGHRLHAFSLVLTTLSSLCSFCLFVTGCGGCLRFHMNFKMDFFCLCKNPHWDFGRNCTEAVYQSFSVTLTF